MDTHNKIDQFINELKEQKLVKRYLCDRTWMSGSSTAVYPITVWKDSIELQWKSDKQIFDKFIDRIVKKYSDLIKSGYFLKSDGSCPSKVIFKLKEERF